jgi:hypothetical protein
MYLDELRQLKNKLELKASTLKNESRVTVIDEIDVPLNIMELEFLLEHMQFLNKRRS